MHICVVRTGFLVVIQMTKDAGCWVRITSLGFSLNDDDKLVPGQAPTSRDPVVMERSFASVSSLAAKTKLFSSSGYFMASVLFLIFSPPYLWGFYFSCLLVLSLDWLHLPSINTGSFFTISCCFSQCIHVALFPFVSLSTNHRVTESQNSRGWKGPLWVI